MKFKLFVAFFLRFSKNYLKIYAISLHDFGKRICYTKYGEERGLNDLFQCGDHVVYGIHGVCRLLEPEVKKVDRAEIAYYVLEPINQSKDRFYVPMNNQTAVEKMKPILSRQELDQLLHSDAVNNDAWISDENLRKQTYRNLISSGDRTALISMVHTLQQRKELLAESGKRLHMCDENFLNDALRVLNSEFSMVLEMKQEAVSDYVRSILCEK